MRREQETTQSEPGSASPWPRDTGQGHLSAHSSPIFLHFSHVPRRLVPHFNICAAHVSTGISEEANACTLGKLVPKIKNCF